MHGRYPRTNAELPPPKRHDGSLWTPESGKYDNLKQGESTAIVADSGFYTYVPEPPKVCTQPTREKTVTQLNAERLVRVRKRQAEAEALVLAEVRVKRYRMRSKGPEARGSADGWE